MKNNFFTKRGFTLVELIVVVTILAILGTIGFISYNGYLSGVRDTNRSSQLVSIHDGLELHSTKNSLPLPDNLVNIKNGDDVLGYQGTAGSLVLDTINFTKGGKDPKTGEYFTYYVKNDRRDFQLMAFLEDSDNSQTMFGFNNGLITSVSANDYEFRYPIVLGEQLGILSEEDTKTPIQEVSNISLQGELDLSTNTGSFTAYFKNGITYTSSGSDLSLYIEGKRSYDVPSNGLLLEYLFDGNANDTSGNGYNGTISGPATFSEGKSGDAINFEDSDYYVYNDEFDRFATDPNSYTYLFWVKHKDAGESYQHYISFDRSADKISSPYFNKLNNGIVHFIKNSNGTYNYPNTGTGGISSFGKWTHVTLTGNGSDKRFYVDGKLVKSYSNMLQAPGNGIEIGKKTGVLGGWLKGQLDNLRIYDRALFDFEVEKVYDLEKNLNL